MASIRVPEYASHLVRMQSWLGTLVAKQRPKRLLDFGCGTGIMFPCWRGAKGVTAYDRSHSMLQEAYAAALKSKFPIGIALPESENRAKTPFTDRAFDFVAMATVLAHLSPEEFQEFANELRRISIPEATWAIITAAPFDASKSTYTWDHDYNLFLGDDTKVIDDHVIAPYRYMEVTYAG